MNKKIKTWNFKIININNFILFLKKFKMVDKSVILELEGNNLFGKINTIDKSVIKYVSININDVFEGELPQTRLKIGILDLSKLIDVFKYFGNEETLNILIDSEPYENELIATKISFYNSFINIFIKCSDISLISYINDKIQQNVHSIENFEINFKFSKENFQKLASLTNIDTNPEEFLNFNIQEKEIKIQGDSFQYQIKDKEINGFKESKTYTIYKKQFSFIDLEDSEIYFHDNRILIKSIETNSIIAIGLIEF